VKNNLKNAGIYDVIGDGRMSLSEFDGMHIWWSGHH